MPGPWDKYGSTAPAPPTVQPQPFPGSIPVGGNPARTQTQDNANTRTQLDVEAGQRAAAALQATLDSNARAQAEFDRKQQQAAITGGVDSTESEATAAFLTTRLEGDARKIDEVLKNAPDAMKPGWKETLSGLFGERARALGTPEKTREARTILNGRYRDAVDVLLTLGTGAAYTKDQRNDYIENFAPQVTDGPAVLEDKKQRFKEAIIAARVKSGVAQGQIDKSLAEIDKLYQSDPSTAFDVGNSKQISGDTEIVPVPPKMQEEYTAFVNSQRPGAMNEGQYLAFIDDLYKRHGYGVGDIEKAKAFVKTFNSGGRVSTTLPGTEKPKPNGVGSSAAEVGAMNFANAMAGGVPPLLAGAEGRERMAMANAESPNAALVGDMAGSIAPTMALERGAAGLAKGLGSASTRAGAGTAVAANALYGAGRGANADPENANEAAAMGGWLGGLGSAMGGAVTKGATPLTSQTTQKAVAELGDVDLSTAQRLGLGHVEKAARGVIGPGGERNRTIVDFNVKNLKEAANTAGVVLPKDIPAGTEGVAALAKSLDDGYNKLLPNIVGAPDMKFASDMKALRTKASGSRLSRDLYRELAELEPKFVPGGKYDGTTLKDTLHVLREKEDDWLNAAAPENGSPDASTYRQMAKVAKDMRQSLIGLVGRNTPAEAKALANLDKGWAKLKVIEHAGIAARGENGVYSPGQYANSVYMRKGGNRVSAARGKGLNQKRAEAAITLMGKEGQADPGLYQNAIAAGLASGSGMLNPGVTAAVGTGLALNYAPVLKHMTKAALTGKRPRVVDNDLTRSIITNALRAKMQEEDR